MQNQLKTVHAKLNENNNISTSTIQNNLEIVGNNSVPNTI